MIDATLIQNALATTGRRDRVFAVCEVIHRHTGTLPSIHETRNYVGRGSCGDISRNPRYVACQLCIVSSIEGEKYPPSEANRNQCSINNIAIQRQACSGFAYRQLVH